ncbi:MAG: hypothetical protein FJZ47_21610 [Candidatus Tectomicrobia bacterium]|uniref:Uncharacterized protein n=1 Tax=Tectimicrobiota bacterium TaxID=2528274 RepID=A0A937W3L6_UNCTE|nr:hypothetical protein [Candidatus Tectomicrobia bacterium]
MLLEHTAQARAHDTWQRLMAQALSGLNGHSVPSTSDEAPALLAYVEHHLGAHHSPDLFHGQHDVVKAVSGPLAAKPRAAGTAATEAPKRLERVQDHLQHAGDEPLRGDPGPPPPEATTLEQGVQEAERARQAYQRLSRQRAQVAQSIRALGQAYHCGDVTRGVRRNGKRIAADIQAHIDTVRPVAQPAGLSQTCLERMKQAERV